MFSASGERASRLRGLRVQGKEETNDGFRCHMLQDPMFKASGRRGHRGCVGLQGAAARCELSCVASQAAASSNKEPKVPSQSLASKHAIPHSASPASNVQQQRRIAHVAAGPSSNSSSAHVAADPSSNSSSPILCKPCHFPNTHLRSSRSSAVAAGGSGSVLK